MGIMIAFFIGVTVLLFAWIKVMEVFFEKRRTPIAVLLLSCLPFLASSIGFSFLFSVHPIVHMTFQLLLLFIITLNYKAFMIKRLVAIGFIFFLLNVIDNSFALFFVFFPHIGLNPLFINFIRLIIRILIFFLTSFFLKRFIKKTKNAGDIPAIWLPALVISSLALFHGILYLAKIPHFEEIWIVIIWIAAFFLIFYLSSTLSTIFEEKIKSVLHSQEKEYYSTQCQLMQESVERVKSIRHDMKTHLAALKEYTSENKAATEYINNLLEDIGESEIYSNTGNIAFDSIINYKLRNAKKENIKLDLRLFVPPVINVEVADIATILGNLLDNALEAVAKVNDKIIRLDIEFGKGGLLTKIENSYNGELQYVEKKREEEMQIVSLKGDGEHGYGLKNIRLSLEKYNGYMKITHTKTLFSVGVFLYLDK